MATNRKPVEFKPWLQVVNEELDRIRDALDAIVMRLVDGHLTVDDKLALQRQRAALEQDFLYLVGELQKPSRRPLAHNPAIVRLADPLDEARLMRTRAAAVESFRRQAECA